MPTYAYRCSTCSHAFEVVQRFSDDPLTECPECGGTVRKVFHPVGIVFKGSGWYINDSRNTTNGSSAPASKTDDAAPAAKSESSDKAPATKSESTEKKPAKVAAD